MYDGTSCDVLAYALPKESRNVFCLIEKKPLWEENTIILDKWVGEKTSCWEEEKYLTD